MIAKLLEARVPSVLKKIYCSEMLDMMQTDRRIVQLEADLGGAMNTGVIQAAFPDRYINCGIMEAQMVGTACGMSVNGMIPFAHSFASFISRRVADQVFMSGCYAGSNVKLIGSDPGVCAETNGGTHQAFEDMGIMRSMANMTVLDVADPILLRQLLPILRSTYGMIYLRMPRNTALSYYDENNTFAIGKAKLLRSGSDVSIIASGICVVEALAAADALLREGIHARVVDMFTIKPIDLEMISDCAKETGCIVTAENH
ncbi:MAG: transketolase C-terminal domain-containing protein, partial [Clostridia bacterium]